ncbi:O-antigen ligase family protein [Thioalkalivibrio sulfidiphilus]|uniref:O-antigen ligase family protein n=1 Tax=Thioalkalivibrio sulfidiphilus TaxID=1033854 RepID=UPI003BB1CC4C
MLAPKILQNSTLEVSDAPRKCILLRGHNSLFKYSWVSAIQVFFIGMLVVPTSFQHQRGVMLLLLTGIAIVLALRCWRVHREVLFLWSATIAVGSFGILWGFFNDAPGALRVSTVYLIWPTLYLLFIGLAHDLVLMRRFESALLVGVVLATFMALIVLAAGLLGLEDLIFPLLAFQDVGFGAYEGFTEFRIYNLSTVMYGFPFVVAVLLSRHRQLSGFQKASLWVLVGLMCIVAVGSGRRMFWLLVLMTPFIALFFLQLTMLRMRVVQIFVILAKLAMYALLAVVGLVLVYDLQLVALLQQFQSAFLGQEESSGLRYEQATALWGAFKDSPLIGIGLGSTVDVVRSDEQPWAYELAPLSLLKSVGLIGTFVYMAAIIWIALRGLALARKDRVFAAIFVPHVVALTGFLAMTFTNPYLEKFDYLWVIFLPVALINAYLTGRRNA